MESSPIISTGFEVLWGLNILNSEQQMPAGCSHAWAELQSQMVFRSCVGWASIHGSLPRGCLHNPPNPCAVLGGLPTDCSPILTLLGRPVSHGSHHCSHHLAVMDHVRAVHGCWACYLLENTILAAPIRWETSRSKDECETPAYILPCCKSCNIMHDPCCLNGWGFSR